MRDDIDDQFAHIHVTLPPMLKALRGWAMRAKRLKIELLGHGELAQYCTEPTLDGGEPFIMIGAHAHAHDDIESTCALAHELGHHESRLRGEWPGWYERETAERAAAILVDVGYWQDDRWGAFLAQECRAWELGRELLRVGCPQFDDWDRYEEIASRSVGTYVEGRRAALASELPPVPPCEACSGLGTTVSSGEDYANDGYANVAAPTDCDACNGFGFVPRRPEIDTQSSR